MSTDSTTQRKPRHLTEVSCPRIDKPYSGFSNNPIHKLRQTSDPTGTAPRNRIRKRIVVCADGTWQDGVATERGKFTNVLRLARMINNEDERYDPPIPQIVFYQSGIGSEDNFYAKWVQGSTGASLGDKVQEAYAFIAHNYHPGDEIFLYGFSRGAYTVRMVALFIGEIGILDRTDMDHFAAIFVVYQQRGETDSPEEKEAMNKLLEPWNQDDSPGRVRAWYADGQTFSIKCVGVWDTVGSMGLPDGLRLRSDKIKKLFGFRDHILGAHIERAYQALAINEERADFDATKFEQSEEGRSKGQVLKQVWFTGEHSDIGGGWDTHDLADVTLTWMAAHVGEMLSLNLKYLGSLPEPVSPWGQQPPHDSFTGLFKFGGQIHRQLPTATGNVTREQIHPSVLEQSEIRTVLKENLDKNPGLFAELLPLEEEIRYHWTVSPGTKAPVVGTTAEDRGFSGTLKKLASKGVELGGDFYARATQSDVVTSQAGQTMVVDRGWAANMKRLTRSTYLGDYLRQMQGVGKTEL